MRLIKEGSFLMGDNHSGEKDEAPEHKVSITRPFYMSATEITNIQYEQFDSSHKMLRGKKGFSKGDDEPVIFVSWHEASAFCCWLSKKEGKNYRLPTEAEWEYCCRAGSKTSYSTGEVLPEIFCKSQVNKRDLESVDLTVKRTPANEFDLYDMHGNAEEWCEDWYWPYLSSEQSDPAGYAESDFKVTRGGSHNTDVCYLRSAQRHGSLPEDRSCFIGFRVVQAEPIHSERYIYKEEKLWQIDVKQERCSWQSNSSPVFHKPIPFINIPECPASVPIYNHNHCPSINWCDNGDIMAIWFSGRTESGREVTILASRLRRGSQKWDMPSEFFKVPDRNMTGSSLFNNGRGTLFHFNGVCSAADWADLCAVVRTSNDNGVSWSKPGFINSEHQHRNQVISGTIETKDGKMIQACDADPSSNGGTAIHISCDGGRTWNDPGANTPAPEFKAGNSGGTIAGIHAGIVELNDGSLLAFGRGDEIEGRMAKSISYDSGKTWHYMSSGFPGIGSGQRLVLKRLNEGPILLISFTDNANYKFDPNSGEPEFQGILAKNSQGVEKRVYGMYAALSYDEGKTWPVKRLISSGESMDYDGGAWTGKFHMDENHGEPMGYLAAAQSPDNMIHLISSRLYYRFNLPWLEE